jgi:hypothetical protein
MKTVFPLSFLSVVLISWLSFSGCKKDNETATVDDLTAQAVDFEQGEQINSDVDDMSDEALQNGDVSLRIPNAGGGNSILSCATVTNDTVAHILTIDFGSGCTGNDGRLRSGQVIIQYNGQYMDAGFTRSISFNNFFVDSNQVTGTRTIVNNGLNGNGNLTWTITAQNLRVTRPGGYYFEWNSTRTREMVAGSQTPQVKLDDVYLITGSAALTNSNGGSCSMVITNSLRKELACHWIVSGTVEITPSGRPVRTLDYGTGSCDHFATVTKNGVTRTIVLH